MGRREKEKRRDNDKSRGQRGADCDDLLVCVKKYPTFEGRREWLTLRTAVIVETRGGGLTE